MVSIKWLIVCLLMGIYFFESFVSVLNRKHSLKAIPASVRDVYDQERYAKWLHYSLETQRFSLIGQGVQLVVMLFFLLSFFPRLARLAVSWTQQPILQSLIFLGITTALMSLINLPFQVYRTFVIEEKHGFNRTTAQIFIKDLGLGLLLSALLGGVLIAIINAVYLRFQANLWIFIGLTWGTMALIMLLTVTFLGKLFLRLFNKLEPLQEGELRTRIEDLALQLGFDVKAIFVMDASKRSTKSNAMFTGLGKSKEVVLFDTLLDKMSDDEIMAVLGHELGHAVHKDIVRLLFQQFVVAALYAGGIGLVLQNPALFLAFGFQTVHFGFALILFSILFGPVSLILSIPINLLSRRAEFKADKFAAEHTQSAWMIRALKVLLRENLVNLNPHPCAVLLYYSHPPMHERIDALL